MLNEYLKACEAALINTNEANIARVEAIEEAHPEVVDEAYRAAKVKSYEIVSGVVS